MSDVIDPAALTRNIESIFGGGAGKYTVPYIIEALGNNKWTNLDDLFRYLWMNFSGGDTCERAANSINENFKLGLEWR